MLGSNVNGTGSFFEINAVGNVALRWQARWFFKDFCESGQECLQVVMDGGGWVLWRDMETQS